MDAAGLFENAGPSSYSPQHPSLFELLAQDQLKDLLQPAVRYVLTVSVMDPENAVLRARSS